MPNETPRVPVFSVVVGRISPAGWQLAWVSTLPLPRLTWEGPTNPLPLVRTP